MNNPGSHPTIYIPGPRAMPLLGWRGNYVRYFRNPIVSIQKLHETYGSVVAFLENEPEWVFAFGPDHNRQLLTNADLFSVKLLFLPTPEDSAIRRLCAGLLNMDGDLHHRQRQLMTPAFHDDQIKNYYPAMVTTAQHFLDRWRVGQVLDITRELRRLTLAMTTRTFFGLEASGEMAQTLGPLINRWLRLFTSDAVNLLPFNLPGLPYHSLLQVSEKLEGHIRAMIEQRRAPAAAPDLLALLIQAHAEGQAGMTEKELIGQTNLAFISGHEKSAVALTWILFLLSQHPRLTAEVCDELEGVLHGAPPTREQLKQLPLLDQVIKESLRLLPPLSSLWRLGTRDFELGSYALPAGSWVTLSPFVTHRLPDLYPDPKRFCPERWSRLTPTPYDYLPFGAGAHACLGTAFVMMQFKIILALLLQRYRLTTPPGTKIETHVKIALSTRQGIPMHIGPRSQPFRRNEVSGNIRQLVELD
jgi:cytochrome P450